MNHRFVPQILLAIFLMTPLLSAAAETDPAEDFRRAEWERRVRGYFRQQEWLAKIPHHDPVYDVTWYDLDVTIDPSDSTLSGSVLIEGRSLVAALSGIDLDLIDTVSVDSIFAGDTLQSVSVLTLQVDSVGGNGVSWTHEDDLLRITLDNDYDSSAVFSVRIDYHGSPRPFNRNGLIWRRHGTQPVIYTMVEPFFSHHWWPCKDVPWDKADSSEVTITVPDNLVGVSNGILFRADSTAVPGWRSYRWKHGHPIPPYLISIAVSNYEVVQATYDPVDGERPSVPISHYVYPEDVVAAETTFALVPQMLGRLEEVFGPYPFRDERYGHAEIYGTGAMEHNTCTSFGDRLIVGNRGSDDVIVHELGHQWWGDLITCEGWEDVWLNEGFATYTEGIWREHRGGPESLTRYMRAIEYTGAQSVYVDPVPDDDSLFSSLYFGAVYSKGAWVLHMLRNSVGDSTFYRILERHKNDSLDRGGFANTAQFIETCETVSGLDLERFFRQWVFLTGAPEFTVEPYMSASKETLWLRLAQDPDQDTCYAADLDVAFVTSGGDTTTDVLPVRAWSDTFLLQPGMDLREILFDEANWLLDTGFNGPVDDVLALTGGSERALLSWVVDDPFVGGVRLYRGASDEGPWEPVTVSPLPASGDYDDGRPAGRTWYMVRAVSDSLPDGYESLPSNVVEFATPAATALVFGDAENPASANPFYPGGDPYRLRFQMAKSGQVQARVYDITGRLVRTLHDGPVEAGFGREIEWDGENADGRAVAAGIYLIRFDTDGYSETRKIVLFR